MFMYTLSNRICDQLERRRLCKSAQFVSAGDAAYTVGWLMRSGLADPGFQDKMETGSRRVFVFIAEDDKPYLAAVDYDVTQETWVVYDQVYGYNASLASEDLNNMFKEIVEAEAGLWDRNGIRLPTT